MTEPERQHTAEPAEGEEPGDDAPGGRTPHPQDPAEGSDSDSEAPGT